MGERFQEAFEEAQCPQNIGCLTSLLAPKPSSGPHKSRECLPLILILRNRLKYALTYCEVISILMQRHILVDGKVRTDKTYPSGFMVMLYLFLRQTRISVSFMIQRVDSVSIPSEMNSFKLCKVRSVQFGQKGIPYVTTYDGRNIRYPITPLSRPMIPSNLTETNKITDFIKFDVGNVVMVTGGNFDTIHVQDGTGREFATRMGNVFTIGKGAKPWVSLPKGKGIKLSIIDEARKRACCPSRSQSRPERHSRVVKSRGNNHVARGLKKHLKRLNAPKHWMLDKLGGAFAPKPSSGPHKSRECLPLILILRNRLKYALTYREVISILMQRHILVDGKVRTDKTYPSGFMDVVSIPKTNENFRLLYDTKGRFRLHSIRDEEAKFKLCKVRSLQFGQKGIPYINTYDGRTIRYPDPLIKANDTIKLDLETNKITDFIKFDVGNVVMVTGGRNRGRVGVIKNREKHKGNFDTIHVQDATGHEFATRMGNVFTIGKGTKPWVSLPKGKGIKLSIIEEARKRLAAQAGAAA
ncbi:unnamed protein product [Camellia sinensis]